MHSINRQRANILFSAYWDQNKVLSPEGVSRQERIFEWDGVLRWRGSVPLGRAHIGISLQALLSSLAPADATTSSTSDAKMQFKGLMDVFAEELYLLSYDSTHHTAYIVLREETSPSISLKAWAHALLVSHRLHQLYATGASEMDILKLLKSTRVDLTKRWDYFTKQLSIAGWDVDVANLETASGTRLRLHANSNGDHQKI